MTNDLNATCETDHSVTSCEFEEDAPRINKPRLFKLADDAIKLWLETDLAVAQTRNEHARAKYESIFRFAWSAINIDPAAFKNINKVKVDKRCADDPWRLPVKYLLEMTKRLYCEKHGSPEAKAEYPSSTLAKAVDLVRIAAKAGIEPDGFGAWWDQYKGVNDILDRFKVKSVARPKSKSVISLSKRQWRIIQRAVVGLASEDEKTKARVLVEDAIHSIDEPDDDDSEKVDAVDDGNDALTAADDETVDVTDHEEHLSADEQLADDDGDTEDDPPPSGGESVPADGRSDHKDCESEAEVALPSTQVKKSDAELIETVISAGIRHFRSQAIPAYAEGKALPHSLVELLKAMVKTEKGARLKTIKAVLAFHAEHASARPKPKANQDGETDPNDDPPPSGGEPLPTDEQGANTETGALGQRTDKVVAPQNAAEAIEAEAKRLVATMPLNRMDPGEVKIFGAWLNDHADQKLIYGLAVNAYTLNTDIDRRYGPLDYQFNEIVSRIVRMLADGKGIYFNDDLHVYYDHSEPVKDWNGNNPAWIAMAHIDDIGATYFRGFKSKKDAIIFGSETPVAIFKKANDFGTFDIYSDPHKWLSKHYTHIPHDF